MVIFNSYVSLPEGNYDDIIQLTIKDYYIINPGKIT